MYRYKKTPMSRINFLIGNSPRVKLQNQSRSIWPSMYRPKTSTHVYSKLGSSLLTPQPKATNIFAPVRSRPATAFWGDSDRDGIINGLDCAPYNKRKQGLMTKVSSSVRSVVGSITGGTKSIMPISSTGLLVKPAPLSGGSSSSPGRITDPGNWAKPIPVSPIISTGVARAIAQPQQTPGTSYTDSNGITHVSPPTGSGGSSGPSTSSPLSKPVPIVTTRVSKVMADPSAVYAKQQGYRYEIRNSPQGGQHGMVILPDGTEIDSWTLYNQAQARSTPGGYKPQPIPLPAHDDRNLPPHKHLMGEPRMSVGPNEEGIFF